MAENVLSIGRVPVQEAGSSLHQTGRLSGRRLARTSSFKSPKGQQGQRPNTLLRPWEFDFVHDVFVRIISEPWFDRAQRSEFALLCLRTYQSGTDPRALYEACERLAKARYAYPLGH